MLLMPNEVEEKKREAEQAALVDTRSPAESVVSLLEPAMPLSPFQQAREEYGTGEAVMRRVANLFTGGLLDDVLIPEMGSGSQAKHKKALESYQDQMSTFQTMQVLNSLDPSKITPAHIALGNEYGGTKFGEYLTDQYAVGQAGIGGDEKIAEAYDYTPYQWSKLSPETKRDLRDRYTDKNSGAGAFDYRQRAEGKAPEQVQEAKEAELFGSGRGQQYSDDRKLITGAQGQVLAQDQQLESLQGVRDNLANPNAKGLTGWPRVVRNFLNANNYTDGAMDAEMATGVVDLISQATFGALSQSELDLLKGGLMNPEKSMEYNIGTLDKAMKRIKNERELTLSNAKGASDRYKDWKGQDDYDTLFENDWLYNNVGEGSRFRAVPKADGSGEVSFSQYSENVISNFKKANPYDDPPTRNDLIVGFNEYREQQESLWGEAEERRKQEAERVELAKKGLSEMPLIFRDAGNP